YGGIEKHGQVYLYAIGSEYIGQDGRFFDKRVCQDFRVGVYIVEYRTVNPYGGIEPGIVGVPGIPVVGEGAPVPERQAGIPAFNDAVEVVPMVDHSPGCFGGVGQADPGEVLSGLHKPDEGERPVEEPV